MTLTLSKPPCITPPEHQLPFLEDVRTMLDNPMEAWPREVYQAPVYVPPRQHFRRIYVCDPDALKRIFIDDVENFPKSPLAQRLLRPMLGDGLVTADLSEWRWQRRAAAPAFQPQGFARSAPVVARIAQAAVERWRKDQAAERDMCAEMMRITFDIILETMLGGASEADAVEMGNQFTAYLAHLGRPSVADLMGAPDWVRTLLSPDGGHSVRYMRARVSAMIERRRASPPREDLIDLLLNARDKETGRAMTARELEDNLLTFLAAGHETTALALTWSVYLLSQNTGAAERIRTEVARTCGTEPIASSHVGQLTFTKQVLYEAMRLYPPVPVLSRVAARDCKLAGVSVRRGDAVVIPIYALHRHDLYWRDPDSFDPNRFEPGAGVEHRRFVYMPFGAGLRICLGMSFATSEAIIVLATLLRDADFVLRQGFKIRPLLRITMRPDGGLPMRVAAR